MTELNTLIGLPSGFDTSSLVVSQTYKIVKDRERSFPLHIAMLMVDSEWNFYGYAVVHSMKNTNQKCELEFEVLSIFSPEEQKLYKAKFTEAAHFTGEIK